MCTCLSPDDSSPGPDAICRNASLCMDCSTGSLPASHAVMQEDLLLILHIQGIGPQLLMIKSWQILIPAIRRNHLYGDIYSSPGLEMRQKQLLMCAFLGQANMPDELFGHAVAVSPTPTSKRISI